MTRSRADEILGGWKMVAHSATRPALAPRPRTSRIAISLGVVATAAVAVIVMVALGARGLGPSPGPSLPAGGEPTATPSSSPGVTVSPSPAVSVSPSPDATPSAGSPSPGSSAGSPSLGSSAGSPSAADVAAAAQAADQYTADLVRGAYSAAFSMLGPEAQAHWGSLSNFTYDRSVFFKSVAGRYTVTPSPSGVAPITDWLSGTYGAHIDLGRAVLVEVDYPELANNNAGWDLYIVAPGSNGLVLYDVR